MPRMLKVHSFYTWSAVLKFLIELILTYFVSNLSVINYVVCNVLYNHLSYQVIFKIVIQIHEYRAECHRIVRRVHFSSYMKPGHNNRHYVTKGILFKLTEKMLERSSPAPEIYTTTRGRQFICTRAHDTTRDGRRRRTANFCSFRLSDLPVCNDYYFTDTTVTVYSYSTCEYEILYFSLRFSRFFFCPGAIFFFFF